MKSAKDLQKELTFSVDHISRTHTEMWEKSQKFCEEYKEFLSVCKTEREAVSQVIKMAQANGYTEYDATKVSKTDFKVPFSLAEGLARTLEFEKAAYLRDRIKELKNQK